MQSPVILSETSLQLICNRSHCTKTRNTSTGTAENNSTFTSNLSKNRFKFTKLIIQASSFKRRTNFTYHHSHCFHHQQHHFPNHYQHLNHFKCNSSPKDHYFHHSSDLDRLFITFLL